MKPIQYQKGYVEFYKLKFRVTSDVLIPRPETELLIDEVLNSIKYYVLSIKPEDILVADIGTGSGNIAISVACNTTGVKIIAIDISASALKVAKKNAMFNHVENKVTFVESDLLPGLILNTEHKALIIVANLPYIPTERINYLDSSVKDFEPHIALDGGTDGFGLYRKLFQQIVLPLQGWQHNLKLLIGEIDYTHGELAYNEAYRYFPDAQIEVKTDLAHLQRILTIRF